jgi:hypothetical protein
MFMARLLPKMDHAEVGSQSADTNKFFVREHGGAGERESLVLNTGRAGNEGFPALKAL